MKKNTLRWGRFYAALVLLMLISLALPVVFAGHNAFSSKKNIISAPLPPAAIKASWKSAAMASYDNLNLSGLGLSEKAFDYAIEGLEKLKAMGKLANDHIISIVDFTRPSSEKRLFIIDLEKEKLLYHTYVAHGRNSGTAQAEKFSNNPSSHQSSLGFYVTSGTYQGGHGLSMFLEGMEPGINHLARERAIVMHGAPYVQESMAKTQGFIGRSWGCPAVPEKLNRPIIETIKNGTCLFIYAEKNEYIRKSRILNS